jgi:aryl-alcohol dehydrogenase-like predicted oxidoreductase
MAHQFESHLGTRSVKHLEGNVTAVDIKLDDEDDLAKLS